MSNNSEYKPSSSKPKKRVKKSKSSSSDEVNYSVLNLLDEVLVKLRFLDYEEKFCKKYKFTPILPNQFISPAHTNNFHYFGSLVSWIMSLSHHNFPQPNEMDDPNVTANNIAIELKKVGLSADYAANKLKLGRGESVLASLNALLSKTLATKGFEAKPIAQPKVSEMDDEIEEIDNEEDDEADLMNEIEDEAIESDSDEEEFFFGTSADDTGTEKRMQREESGVMTTTTNPQEWAMELERVRPQLRVTLHTDNKEWRTHFDDMKNHSQSISECLQVTQKQLKGIAGEISDGLGKISTREKHLNSQCSTWVEEYKKQKQKFNKAKESYDGASGTVNKLQDQLKSISDELESVKDKLDEKGSEMNDSKPLESIKNALNTLKKETKSVDIRVATLQHILLNASRKPNKGLDFNSSSGLVSPTAELTL